MLDCTVIAVPTEETLAIIPANAKRMAPTGPMIVEAARFSKGSSLPVISPIMGTAPTAT